MTKEESILKTFPVGTIVAHNPNDSDPSFHVIFDQDEKKSSFILLYSKGNFMALYEGDRIHGTDAQTIANSLSQLFSMDMNQAKEAFPSKQIQTVLHSSLHDIHFKQKRLIPLHQHQPSPFKPTGCLPMFTKLQALLFSNVRRIGLAPANPIQGGL